MPSHRVQSWLPQGLATIVVGRSVKKKHVWGSGLVLLDPDSGFRRADRPQNRGLTIIYYLYAAWEVNVLFELNLTVIELKNYQIVIAR